MPTDPNDLAEDSLYNWALPFFEKIIAYCRNYTIAVIVIAALVIIFILVLIRFKIKTDRLWEKLEKYEKEIDKTERR